MSFGDLWCLRMPWHKAVEVRRLSGQADYYRGKCGRQWAVNHDVRCVVPYNEVRQLYEDDSLLKARSP